MCCTRFISDVIGDDFGPRLPHKQITVFCTSWSQNRLQSHVHQGSHRYKTQRHKTQEWSRLYLYKTQLWFCALWFCVTKVKWKWAKTCAFVFFKLCLVDRQKQNEFFTQISTFYFSVVKKPTVLVRSHGSKFRTWKLTFFYVTSSGILRSELEK